MSRPIKKSVHIFFPEADCRGDKIKLSEDFTSNIPLEETYL